MKRISLLLFAIILLPISMISQGEQWPVKAFAKNGKTLPVNVYLEDGTTVPVFAIYAAGNDHFMDVKGVHNGEKISIKMIASDEMYVPVKGISQAGNIYRVKAVDSDGTILDVKGVSRDGNTLNMAAIDQNDNFLPLKAVSPEGLEREVKGVKVMDEFFEMEFGDIKVIAHVKAIPVIKVGKIDSKWEIAAFANNEEKLNLVAINKDGREFPVSAEMPGKHPYLMNVRAESRIVIYIKLVKSKDGLVLSGLDEFGRRYAVRAKASNGEFYEVVGGKTAGNVTPIYVMGEGGTQIPLKAISSKGHEFDVKGIKVKEDDVEGTISGLNIWVSYYAHVKALAPAKLNQ